MLGRDLKDLAAAAPVPVARSAGCAVMAMTCTRAGRLFAVLSLESAAPRSFAAVSPYWFAWQLRSGEWTWWFVIIIVMDAIMLWKTGGGMVGGISAVLMRRA